MIMRILIMFSFIWFLSGCLPALASDCEKLCSSSWWKTASTSDLKLELTKEIDINAKNSWGWTPLHHAAKTGNTKNILLLLKQKANINAQCKKGNTPLHIAALNAGTPSVLTLLEAGSNTRMQNNAGNTAYTLAERNKRIVDTKTLKRLKP